MNTSFQILHEGGHDKIVISGPINEEAEVQMGKIAENVGNNVVINFRQVTFINSLGVRAWINLMRELSSKKLTFQECTPEIVNQINMIPNFKGNAAIESVYGTFFCEKCEKTHEELFVTGKNFPQPPDFKLASVTCKNCGHPNIEFEEVEESFFAFARG